MSCRKKKNDEVMNDLRLYWREPRLASQLSKEQRKKATEKFQELLEKSKEEHNRRMNKVME